MSTETNETVMLVDGRQIRMSTDSNGVLQIAWNPGPCDWSGGTWRYLRPSDDRAIFDTIATLQAQQQQNERSDVLIAELRIALRSTLEMMGRHDVECEALMGRSCSCGRDAAKELLKRAEAWNRRTPSAQAPGWVACVDNELPENTRNWIGEALALMPVCRELLKSGERHAEGFINLDLAILRAQNDVTTFEAFVTLVAVHGWEARSRAEGLSECEALAFLDRSEQILRDMLVGKYPAPSTGDMPLPAPPAAATAQEEKPSHRKVREFNGGWRVWDSRDDLWYSPQHDTREEAEAHCARLDAGL